MFLAYLPEAVTINYMYSYTCCTCAMAIDCCLYYTIAFFRCPDESYGIITSARISKLGALLFHDIILGLMFSLLFMELCYSVICSYL